MTGSVDDLWNYPVKGARGRRPEFLIIEPTIGVADDRRYAIRRKAGNKTEWSPKAAFFVCMNTALMAAQEPVFAGMGINQLDSCYLKALAQQLGGTGELQVQDTGGVYNLCDTKGAYVSFLNLASVQALSKFIGQEIVPSRFRMNVWMKGLEPFEELTWVDKFPGTREILVGDCRFRVDDACERCRAVEANPTTGEYDLKVLDWLSKMMERRSYKSPHRGVSHVMGILAAPLNQGVTRRRDAIRLA
jgi:MOSC domain-containing protein